VSGLFILAFLKPVECVSGVYYTLQNNKDDQIHKTKKPEELPLPAFLHHNTMYFLRS